MRHDGSSPIVLLALEDQRDRLAVRPYDASHHGAIRGKSVAFESNRAGLRVSVRHFQDVVIPPRLRLELFARGNRDIVLAVARRPPRSSVQPPPQEVLSYSRQPSPDPYMPSAATVFS